MQEHLREVKKIRVEDLREPDPLLDTDERRTEVADQTHALLEKYLGHDMSLIASCNIKGFEQSGEGVHHTLQVSIKSPNNIIAYIAFALIRSMVTSDNPDDRKWGLQALNECSKLILSTIIGKETE